MLVVNLNASLIRLLLCAALLACGPLGAAVLTVTNLNDTGAGSLRDTCAAAAAGDYVVFEASLAGTITFASEINLNFKALNIAGNLNSAGKPTITLDGNDATRLITAIGGFTVSDLRFTGGHSTGGGALQVVGLAAYDCVFEGNRTSGGVGGGAIYSYQNGSVTLSNCTFKGNSVSATERGGAVYNVGDGLAHGCTFEANSGGFGGALCGFTNTGAYLFDVQNCTFYGNSADVRGGAIYVLARGGDPDMRVDSRSCTFQGNTCAAAGGGQCVAVAAETITSGAAVASFHARNSIFADAQAGGMFISSTTGPGTETATFASQGHNLCTDTQGWLSQTGDLTNTDPLLLPLAENGGPTRTHALSAGSPAIDAGTATGTPATDQRAKPRGAMHDIGAFELQPGEGVVADDGDDDGGCTLKSARPAWLALLALPALRLFRRSRVVPPGS